MEEDCDGLCWQYIVNEDKLRPDVVVVTDSTDCTILRGQRGRMEIGVTTHGRSCHGSMPDQGENAVYKIAAIVREIEAAPHEAQERPVPRQGDDHGEPHRVQVAEPLRRAGPGLHPSRPPAHDRRHQAVGRRRSERRDQAGRREGRRRNPALRRAELHRPRLRDRKVLPHLVRRRRLAAGASRRAKRIKEVLGGAPKVHRWTFSTNGVAIAGLAKIPCVGFGPAPESVAHTVDDSVPIEHLVKCAAFYAAFPQAYCDLTTGLKKTKTTVGRKR